jgi:hypothetical protein
MLPRDFNQKLLKKGTYRNARKTLVGLSLFAQTLSMSCSCPASLLISILSLVINIR